MIISRAPVRISLGGGGTDLPSYYKKKGAFLVSGAINKYIYIVIHDRYEKGFLLKYYKNQLIDDYDFDKIEHPMIREVLRYFQLKENIDIASFSDVPPNSGLGTSGAFLAGLINAVAVFKKINLSKYDIADLACKIEIDILERFVGKLDQFISVFGLLSCIEIEKSGNVKIYPLNIKQQTKKLMEKNSALYFTGLQRDAGKILENQSSKTSDNDKKTMYTLDKIKEISYRIKDALEEGRLEDYGRLLHTHWMAKQQLSSGISNITIEKIYQKVLDLGALGGKIMGAGGGGFLMFYIEKNHDEIDRYLAGEGMRKLDFRFDNIGVSTIYTEPGVLNE
jgi:D-glycero-alpha-D-manno-heptose-7-phosphate kinase